MPPKRKPKSNTAAGLAEFARQEAKRAAQTAREQAIFQMACLKRGITPTTGPKIFGVSRPSFWAWMHSKHRIPHKAFVRLAELDAQVESMLNGEYRKKDFIIVSETSYEVVSSLAEN